MTHPPAATDANMAAQRDPHEQGADLRRFSCDVAYYADHREGLLAQHPEQWVAIFDQQLVGVNLPSDAVLTAKGASGAFIINSDGTFSGDSKITIDVTTLASDQRDRDNFVKMDTLQTRQFPTATFVPTKVTGLTLPLASGEELKFTLAGKMTIHGKTKDVTFDVVAKRSGGTLTATATANPTWKFEDFGMSAPSVPFRVVSVNDEIRLVVDIVATGSAS